MSAKGKTVQVTPEQRALAEIALRAYAIDVSYAVSMCKRASVILGKQAVFRARGSLNPAVTTAMDTCAASGAFTCAQRAGQACGVGPACRYSLGTLRTFDPEPEPLKSNRGGKSQVRPQPGPDGSHGTFNVEAIVHAWRDVLEAASQGP